MRKFIQKFAAPLCLSVLLFAAIFSRAAGKADVTRDYIRTYSPVAIREMHRSGIPASITMAQGILESASGTSRLAREANNHFGIKCHSDWTGESIREDDDAKGECFRKYSGPEESYRDHSDFLRYKERYKTLFSFEITDYKSWAYGLKKAGYATDPQYAVRLVEIIERYGLSALDTPDAQMAMEAHVDSGVGDLPATPEQLESPEKYEGTGHSGHLAVSLQREVMTLNGVAFIYAREGETYKSIASRYELFPGELASFNDAKLSRTLLPGEKVYIQVKARRAAKGLDKHICAGGERLWEISQKYAVRLSSLMKYNHISDPMMQLPEDMTVNLRKAGK